MIVAWKNNIYFPYANNDKILRRNIPTALLIAVSPIDCPLNYP